MSALGSERPVERVPSSSAGRSPSPPPATDTGLAMEEIDVLLRIAAILRELRFGSVLVVVQDGKVVQIETAEKIRLR